LTICDHRRPERSESVPHKRFLASRDNSGRGAAPRDLAVWQRQRVYVGLENGDGVTAIDTLTHKVIATVPVGQAPQALTYVCNAVPSGSGTQNLQSLGIAGQVAHLALSASAAQASNAPTSVSLFRVALLGRAPAVRKCSASGA
jgi:YVTN family beta-propeller protein